MKRISLFILLGIGMLPFSHLRGQETDFSHQVIIESKAEYNNRDKKSRVNPDNRMNIEEFTSITHLYPILNFRNSINDLTTSLQLEGDVVNYNFSKDSVQFAFQEIYVGFAYREKHYFSFGKRRLYWGTGMIWNPTNFYVQKDPFRTRNRLEGIMQGSYALLLPKGTLQAYVFPDRRLKDFSYALKYDFYASRIDGGISFLQYTRYQQFGFDLSYGGDLFTAYAEGVWRNYSKSCRVGEDGLLIVPGTERKKFFTEIVGGISYNLNARISLRAEYRFREDYLNKKEVRRFETYLPEHLMIYDPISVGQHSLFGSIEWKDTFESYYAQLRSFYDPVSGQLIVSPLFIVKINNFQLELSSMIYNNSLSVFNYQGSLLISCHF